MSRMNLEETTKITFESSSPQQQQEESFYDETVYSEREDTFPNKRSGNRPRKHNHLPTMNTNTDWEQEETLPRRQGFPAYKGPMIRQAMEDSEDRLSTPYMSYSPTNQNIRGCLPAKLQWDGTTAGFQDYKYAIEGFYTQCNAAYLFDPTFHKIYIEVGPSRSLDHPDLPRYIKVSRSELEAARTHLFGAIQQSTRKSNIIRKHINKHKDVRDGIKVWIDLAKTQDNDGNSDVRESRLLRITTQLYSPSYPGGLARYLDDINDAYSGLEVLDNYYTDHQKIHALLTNLQISGVNDFLLNHCRDTFDNFEDCIIYLRKEAVRREDIEGLQGRRHAKAATSSMIMPQTASLLDYEQETTDKSSNDTLDFVLNTIQDSSLEWNSENIRMVQAAMQRNKDFYIHKPVYEILKRMFTPDQLKQFLDEKLKAEKLDQIAKETNPRPRPNENIPPVPPRQYQREAQAKLATMEPDYDSDSSGSS